MLNQKSKIKLLVDIMMFLLFIVNAGIGLVLKFAVINRSNTYCGLEHYEESGFIGLNRADWLKLHLLLSLFLIIAIAVHLKLNLKTISHYFNRELIPKIPTIYWISFINSLLFIILIASPLIKTDERQDKIHSESIIKNTIKPASNKHSTKYRNKIFLLKIKPEPAKKKQID